MKQIDTFSHLIEIFQVERIKAQNCSRLRWVN